MSIFTKIFKFFFDECETKGVSVPLMYDPVADRASITILFPYVSFWATAISLVFLHVFPNVWPATLGCGMLWLLSTVLYMIRKLSKAKFDLNSKTIEFDSEPESQNSGTTVSNVTANPEE